MKLLMGISIGLGIALLLAAIFANAFFKGWTNRF